MGSTPKKPSKHANPLGKARDCLKRGNYTVTYHAEERQAERVVPIPDAIYTIEVGYHEKRKDRFDEAYQAWNYSIRGKTTDKRDLRVVISFDQDGLLIITVVVL